MNEKIVRKRKFYAEAVFRNGLWCVGFENSETGERIAVKKDLHPLDARSIAEEWEEKFNDFAGDDSTLIEILNSEND